MRTSLPLCLAFILAACGDSPARDAFATNAPTDGGASTTKPSEPGDPGFGKTDAGPIGDVSDEACTDEARRVYVVAVSDNALYSFEPDKLKFTRIGVIDCQGVDKNAAGGRPHSMAVDRNGTAWVNLSGQTYKVSTKDASCSLTGTTFKNTKWSYITMGFATDTESSNSERMYLVGPGVNGAWDLGKFDTKTLQTEGVGTFLGEFKRKAELTGTGNGRLFGFFTSVGGSPMVLAEIDKATAAVTKVVDVEKTNVASGNAAYAFSFWGGDFWFYFSTDDKPSKVIRYRAATDKSQEVVIPDVGGFQISGAGVSTCAPTVPPVIK